MGRNPIQSTNEEETSWKSNEKMGHEVWKVEVEVQMNEIGITDQRTTMEGIYDQRT